MANHPNRSKTKTAASRPPPPAIVAYRRALKLTQREAAGVIYGTEASWRAWEAGDRPMHPAMWELFRLKTFDGQVLKALGLQRIPNDPLLRPENLRIEGGQVIPAASAPGTAPTTAPAVRRQHRP